MQQNMPFLSLLRAETGDTRPTLHSIQKLLKLAFHGDYDDRWRSTIAVLILDDGEILAVVSRPSQFHQRTLALARPKREHERDDEMRRRSRDELLDLLIRPDFIYARSVIEAAST